MGRCFEVDGTKYVSQTDVAKVIVKLEISAREILKLKAFKALPSIDSQTGKNPQVGILAYVLNDLFITKAYGSHWATKG